MNHLITGGSGFLGSLITRELLARGERVRVADVWQEPEGHSGAEFFHCDVCDRQAVRKAMHGVDVVHHNAALVPLTKSGKAFWKVNVGGSRIVVEEAARAGVRSFIHMSSSAVYGAAKEQPIMLSTPACPVEAYGRSKLASELAVREICNQFGIQLIIIRPRTILGPGRLGIFQILFKWIKSNANVYVIGGGNVPFQFIHARDLIDAYMLAAAQSKAGTYNVGTDRYGTMRQALENLIAYANSQSKVISLPKTLTTPTLQILDLMRLSPLAPWHYRTYHKPFSFDIEHVLELGWAPRYSNDEMLRESYDSFLTGAETPNQAGMLSPHRKRVNESILWLLRKVF
jgi:nucleoside-diphosphate-sugar epimerase